MKSPQLLRVWLLTSLLACTPAQQAAPPPQTATAALPPADTEPVPPPTHRELPAMKPGAVGVAVGYEAGVASAENHASRIGLSILRRGGNAIDAAIAVGFALAVTHPSAGNIGGGGFMVVRLGDGTATTIDYRETAPAAATPDMYLDAAGEVTRDSLDGARAAGIPGTVSGFALAYERFGSLPWIELVMPAVVLARDGHALDEHHQQDLARALERMQSAGQAQSVRYYQHPSGRPFDVGENWRQPELAATLQRIAEQGPRAFYEGELAQRMASEVQKAGGLWTAEDLRGYHAVERKPIVFDYLGHRIISMPPPSAGGVVLREILGASELLDARKHPWRSPEAMHIYIEAARRAYADRNYLLGDPDFADVPTARLTSADYIKARMSDIDPTRATPSSEVSAGRLVVADESHETTHYSVVDRHGNAVSNTYTLNTGFGSKLVIPGTGVLLNNEMDDFAAKPGTPNTYGLVQGERNRIEPRKRMLSSMTPTIVEKDGHLRAVVGTPGGPTITTTVAQIVRALIDYGVPLDEAVAAPRLHHQWMPDRVSVEPDVEPELREGLIALGHEVTPTRWGRFGHANCIEIDPATGGVRAVADYARDGGSAVAY